MSDDPFDPEKLKIPAEMAEQLAREAVQNSARARKEEAAGFTMVPVSWRKRLRGVSGSSYDLALHLLHLNWKAHGHPFKLTNATLLEIGISRQSKWRALREFEQRGLITVQTEPRKSPTITVHA
jgi:hypothetical protein